MRRRMGGMFLAVAALLACEGRSTKSSAAAKEEGSVLVRIHGLDEASVDRVVVEFTAVSSHAVNQTHTIQRQGDNTFNARVNDIEVGDYKVVAEAFSGPERAFWSNEIDFTVVANVPRTLEIFMRQQTEDDLVKTPIFTAVSFESPPVVLEAVGIQVWAAGGTEPLTLSGGGDGTFANLSGDPAAAGGARIEWTPSGPQPGTKTLTLTLTDADLNETSLTMEVHADHQVGDVDFLIHFNHAPDVDVSASIAHKNGGAELEVRATYSDPDSAGGSYLVDVSWDFDDCTTPSGLVLTAGAAFLSEQVDVQSAVQRTFTFDLSDASQPFQCTAEVTLTDANPPASPSIRKASIELNVHAVEPEVPCKADWGNCDGDLANGCETDLTSNDLHCGACDNPCTVPPPNAVGGSCVESVCTVAECAPGWGDCDNDWDNGCESPLDTELNCGACGNGCPLGCDNGACAGFSSLGLGSAHTLAVTSRGALWGWGNSQSYQVVVPGNTVLPYELAALEDIVQASGSTGHSCAVGSTGSLWCWGAAQYGRIGDGSSTGFRQTPTAITSIPGGVKQVSAGSTHTCAVDNGGEAWCWGRNYRRQIGDGQGGSTNSVQLTPKKVPGLTGVEEIREGSEFSCARTAVGEVYCWGRINFVSFNNPTKMAGGLAGKVAAGIDAGYNHVCAYTDQGEAFCWGENNEFGQLGTGNFNDSSQPVAVTGLADVVGISTGNDFSCALTGSGGVWCWGNQLEGRLGNGQNVSNPKLPTPVQIAVPPETEQIASGGTHSCLLTAAGGLWCWGSNFNGKLGVDAALYPYLDVPTEIIMP